MDNFGFIVYRPLFCKPATYAKQNKKSELMLMRGATTSV